MARENTNMPAVIVDDLGEKEMAHLQKLFDKLKNFYAQPVDGYWPLRPKWAPDISKPLKYKSPYRNDPWIRKCTFRRFTFEEFCQIFTMEKWNGIRNTIN